MKKNGASVRLDPDQSTYLELRAATSGGYLVAKGDYGNLTMAFAGSLDDCLSFMRENIAELQVKVEPAASSPEQWQSASKA